MRLTSLLNILSAIALIILLSTTPSDGFNIKADSTSQEAESKIYKDSLLNHYKSPVHERITGKAFCPGSDFQNPENYKFPDGVSRRALFWGVRWNDDPPFQVKNYGSLVFRTNTQPMWLYFFNDAKRRASKKNKVFGPEYALLYRIHFGDLQFVHSMASKDGEKPEDTLKHIMMWCEFTWKIATGAVNQNDVIKTIGVNGLEVFFPKYKHSTKYLFTLGSPDLENNVSEVALGSLLHLVQDSFTKSHVTRDRTITGKECKEFKDAPGVIKQFHNYSSQVSKRHEGKDSEEAFEDIYINKESGNNVVDVSRNIVQLWQRNPKADWQETSNYLKCVFALSTSPDGVISAQDAGPGEEFRRKKK